MSAADRYLRIMYNDLSNDESAVEGLRSVERFLIDTANKKRGDYNKIVCFNNAELVIKMTEGGLLIADSETGETQIIPCSIKYKNVNSEYGGQVLDVAIIKTLLEEKPDMKFEDYLKAIKDNITLSDELANHFTYETYFKPEFKDTFSPLIVREGHLTQDAVEILIIKEIVNKFFEEIIPITSDINSELGRRRVASEFVRKLIEGQVATSSIIGGSCIRDEIPSKIVSTLIKGLITDYKEQEERTSIGKRISEQLQTILPADAAANFAKNPAMLAEVSKVPEGKIEEPKILKGEEL